MVDRVIRFTELHMTASLEIEPGENADKAARVKIYLIQNCQWLACIRDHELLYDVDGSM